MLMMQLLQRKDTTQAADSVLAETGIPPIPAEANSGEVGAIPQMAPEMKNADLNQFRIWIFTRSNLDRPNKTCIVGKLSNFDSKQF